MEFTLEQIDAFIEKEKEKYPKFVAIQPLTSKNGAFYYIDRSNTDVAVEKVRVHSSEEGYATIEEVFQSIGNRNTDKMDLLMLKTLIEPFDVGGQAYDIYVASSSTALDSPVIAVPFLDKDMNVTTTRFFPHPNISNMVRKVVDTAQI